MSTGPVSLPWPVPGTTTQSDAKSGNNTYPESVVVTTGTTVVGLRATQRTYTLPVVPLSSRPRWELTDENRWSPSPRRKIDTWLHTGL